MAGEIQFRYQTGKTCYAVLRNRTAAIWSTSGGTGGFETYTTGNFTDYDIAATEQGTASRYYVGNMPAAMPAGIYSMVAKEQLGASPAETDPDVAEGDVHWNGTAIVPLADVATSGQVGQYLPSRLFRGQMLQNFPFKMVSAADHFTAFTSGVISGQISRDGGSFGVLQSGAFTEMGLGWYSLQALTSGDMSANTVAVTFSAVGISGGAADRRDMAFVLQRTSGQMV